MMTVSSDNSDVGTNSNCIVCALGYRRLCTSSRETRNTSDAATVYSTTYTLTSRREATISNSEYDQLFFFTLGPNVYAMIVSLR